MIGHTVLARSPSGHRIFILFPSIKSYFALSEVLRRYTSGVYGDLKIGENFAYFQKCAVL